MGSDDFDLDSNALLNSAWAKLEIEFEQHGII